jgi:hypothetical protein
MVDVKQVTYSSWGSVEIVTCAPLAPLAPLFILYLEVMPTTSIRIKFKLNIPPHTYFNTSQSTTRSKYMQQSISHKS